MAATPIEVKKHVPARRPDGWKSLQEEMDRMFERVANGFRVPALRNWFERDPAWTYAPAFSFPNPAVDVTEDGKGFTVTVELPGLEEKDIDVTVAGGMLTIKGEKSFEKDDKDKDHHISERAFGSFQRSFALPDAVDADKIAANLAKGVLTITLPKTAKRHKIEVKKAA
jgi:HSP20 family protein